MAKAKAKAGRVDMQDLLKLVNKKAGRNVAHDLTGDNPTSVKEWIPTGSRWLDSIICKGRLAGIPDACLRIKQRACYKMQDKVH